MRARASAFLAVSCLTLLTCAAGACDRASSLPGSSSVAAKDAAPQSPSHSSTSQPLKTLSFEYSGGSKPVVGAQVKAGVAGLVPGEKVELNWETVTGEWAVENYYRFLGKRFSERTVRLGEAQVAADGSASFHFAIPEDFGGVHTLMVSVAGAAVAQGGIEVVPTFELHPREGPVGTPVEIRAKGIGWRNLDSTWVVNWDNHEVGWVSAITSRGTAVARWRASGPVGEHQVKVYTGYTGHAYLNHEQAPNAYLPRPQFTFHVTAGRHRTESAYAEPYAPQPVPPVEPGVIAATLTPTQGPVQTRATLAAAGLPANRAVSLVWETQAGSRVTDAGFAPKETAIGQVTVGADGRLSTVLTVPDDLGGLHWLSVRSGADTLARAPFTIETSIVSMTPVSGPVGTPVSIHLKGVGWTDYDNIYVATYDNAYMGYACGFNSQGDVVINFIAAGPPGLHLIDLYPGIYQGPEQGQQVYRLPQLTYAVDHPGNRIPALRFTFEVTPSARAPKARTSN